jgi:hypothetical protein
VWFDSPVTEPHELKANASSAPLLIQLNGPIPVRKTAFALASQIYAWFGYDESLVAFSEDASITFEASTVESALSAIISYLRGRVNGFIRSGPFEFSRRMHWFGAEIPLSGNFIQIGVSTLFVRGYGSREAQLFAFLDSLEIEDALIAADEVNKRLAITTKGLEFIDSSP